MAIYYVDGYNGNDTNDGSTLALAFRTFAKAVDSVTSEGSDTIYIAPGIYTEQFNTTSAKDGSSGNNFTDYSNRHKVIGLGRVIIQYGESWCMYVHSNYWYFENIEFSGNVWVNVNYSCVYVPASQYGITFKNCRFFNNYKYSTVGYQSCCMSLYGNNSYNLEVLDCVFINNVYYHTNNNYQAACISTRDIFSQHYNSLTVRNCTFANNKCMHVNTSSVNDIQGADICFYNATASSGDFLVENCIFYNSQIMSLNYPRAAVITNTGHTMPKLRIKDCLFSDVPGKESTLGYSSIDYESSEPYGTERIDIKYGDPKFVDIDNYDYRIQQDGNAFKGNSVGENIGAAAAPVSLTDFTSWTLINTELDSNNYVVLTGDAVSGTAESPVIDLGEITDISKIVLDIDEDHNFDAGYRAVVDKSASGCERLFEIKIGEDNPITSGWVDVREEEFLNNISGRYIQFKITLRIDGV